MPNLGIRALNRFSHSLSSQITWWTSRLGFEQVRRRAGLPKRKLFWPFEDNPPRLRTPILCAWSPVILGHSSDWTSTVHVTGYYFFPSDQAYQPPLELDSFLKEGKPPICISFGSMVNKDAERIDQIIRDSLKQTNHRGITLSGWSDVKDRSSADLLYLESAPHDWLLPRCSMIIHHGGAGTTSAGLRAGIPNVVVPFMADQPFWGRRVHAIGAGPKPILVNQLSVETLTHAIAEAESDAIRARAQAIGGKISAEDGVANAVRMIESHAAVLK